MCVRRVENALTLSLLLSHVLGCGGRRDLYGTGHGQVGTRARRSAYSSKTIVAAPGTAFSLHRIEIWPFVETLAKMTLAMLVGTLVGLERAHRGKAGVRTFALAALLGAMGGLLGDVYGAIAMGFVAVFIGLMNWREMVREKKLALTTSVALTVVGFAGIMCGFGHVFTPVAACIATTGLLSLKNPIAGLAGRISDVEIRSAVLLALLACVIYPVLPAEAIDPWGLIEPQENWIAVIAIAAIGFVSYVLLKLLGPKGMEVTAFFGGLVNSRKVIIEMIGRSYRRRGTRGCGPKGCGARHRGYDHPQRHDSSDFRLNRAVPLCSTVPAHATRERPTLVAGCKIGEPDRKSTPDDPTRITIQAHRRTQVRVGVSGSQRRRRSSQSLPRRG